MEKFNRWLQKHPIISTLIIAFALHLILQLPIIRMFEEKKDSSNSSQQLAYNELIEMIEENMVSKITIESGSGYATSIIKTNEEVVTITDIPDESLFSEYIHSKIVSGESDLKFEVSSDEFLNDLFDLLLVFVILMIVVTIFLKSIEKIFFQPLPTSNSYGEYGTSTNSKESSKYIEKVIKSDVRFSDVAGLEEEKQELIEVVDFLRNPEKYTVLGAEIPRGVLLSGEPGTGKTLLAKAVAGEAEVAFMELSGPECIEIYVGTGAKRIREAFEEARKNAPCIIFIDEIDAIGTKREEVTDGGSSEHNQTLEQLLIELDGFKNRDGLIVLAATNRPESLDPALTRPKRFDRKVEIHLPDVNSRIEILKVHSKNKPFFEDVDLKRIAYNTAGFSGAELENLLNEAAILAARNSKSAISRNDIDEAMLKVSLGLQKANKLITDAEKKITSVHEAGHTIVAQYLETRPKVKEVSIIPRGSAGGYTLHESEENKSYASKKSLTEELICLLGGRVAEELLLKDISSGSSNDLEVATNIARMMIMAYGMNEEVGPVSFLNKSGNIKSDSLGQEKFNLASEAIVVTLKNAENRARQILKVHIQELNDLTELLLEKEVITGKEVEKLCTSIDSLSDNDKE